MLLDFDLCFSEVLDMNTRSYLSLKRLRIIMRKEVDDSDIEGVIFVHAYTQEFIKRSIQLMAVVYKPCSGISMSYYVTLKPHLKWVRRCSG